MRTATLDLSAPWIRAPLAKLSDELIRCKGAERIEPLCRERSMPEMKKLVLGPAYQLTLRVICSHMGDKAVEGLQILKEKYPVAPSYPTYAYLEEEDQWILEQVLLDSPTLLDKKFTHLLVVPIEERGMALIQDVSTMLLSPLSILALAIAFYVLTIKRLEEMD